MMHGKPLLLTNDNMRKIQAIRDVLAKLNPERSGAFASVTFPLPASKVLQAIARRLGIPITDSGICFVVKTKDDLDRAEEKLDQFEKEVENLKEILEPDTEG